MHSEKAYLESLLEQIEDPSRLDEAVNRSIRYTRIATALGGLSIAGFAWLYDLNPILAIAGFMVGVIFSLGNGAKAIQRNMRNTRGYLNEQAIRDRIRELNV